MISTLALLLLSFGPAPPRTALAGGPVVATDATGVRHEFHSSPERIISLNPDFTANLIALGVGERLAGGTDFCPLPEEKTVGSLAYPDLEKIVFLAPDLVLATREGNRPQTVAALRRAGIKVFVAAPCRSFEDYFSLLHTMGAVLGRQNVAAGLVDRIREEISGTRRAVRGRDRPRVFVQLGASPIVSANRRTLIHQAVEAAGGVNVTADWPNRYPALSRETVMSLDPEVIVVAIMGKEGVWGASQWADLPGLRAGREDRIHLLDPDLICQLTPRLGEGVSRLAELIHGRPAAEAGRAQ